MRDSERELATLLIAALNLEDKRVDEIDPSAPLFGDAGSSWGLDSIDALEIALAIQQKYGVELRAEDEATRQAFASLTALVDYVAQRRADA
ncbi:MAG: phosphopantetheine-binding protein [Nevskiales bacterium]